MSVNRTTAKDALARVRNAHTEIQQAAAEVSQRIDAKKARIRELAYSGAIPVDEALEYFRDRFDSYADRGRKMIERWAHEFTVPSHAVDELHIRGRMTPDADDLLTVRRNPNGTIKDPGPVIAYLFRAALVDQAEAIIRERCNKPTIPPAAERPEEIKRELDTLKRLESEHDDLIDEQASLFGGKKSERTQKREKIEEAQRRYEEANADAAANDRERGEPRSPAVTVQDADGNEVPSRSLGWR